MHENDSDPRSGSAPPVICHGCGRLVPRGRGAFFLVQIEAIADPTPPGGTGESDDERDESFASLFKAMEGMSGQELQDQVYRRLNLTLCNPCFARWIDRPVEAGAGDGGAGESE